MKYKIIGCLAATTALLAAAGIVVIVRSLREIGGMLEGMEI